MLTAATCRVRCGKRWLAVDASCLGGYTPVEESSMYSAPRGSSGNFLKRNAAPLTTTLILCNVAALLVEYGLPGIFERPFGLLTFTTTTVVAQPWTLVTYPL